MPRLRAMRVIILVVMEKEDELMYLEVVREPTFSN